MSIVKSFGIPVAEEAVSQALTRSGPSILSQFAEEVSLDDLPEGSIPEKPIQEAHPESGGLRFAIKNLSPTEETAERYLRDKGFEAHQLGPWNWSIRRPGEKEWRVLDPSGFDVQDVSDILGDTATAIGSGIGATASTIASLPSGPGAIAAGVAGGAAGGAATEAGKQALASLFTDLDPSAGEVAKGIAAEAAYGAGGELASAALKPVFRGVKNLAKKALPKSADELLSEVRPGEIEFDPRIKTASPGIQKLAREANPEFSPLKSKEDLLKELGNRSSLTKNELLEKERQLEINYFGDPKVTESTIPGTSVKVTTEKLMGMKPHARGSKAKPSILQTRLDERLAQKKKLGHLGLDDTDFESIRADVSELFEEELKNLRKKYIDVDAAGDLEHLELAKYAQSKDVNPYLSDLDVARQVYGRQIGPRLTSLAGKGIQRLGEIAEAPARAFGRVAEFVASGGPIGAPFRAQLKEERKRTVQGLRQFADDYIAKYAGRMDDPSSREFVEKLFDLRSRLTTASGEARELSESKLKNLWQSLYATAKEIPEFGQGTSAAARAASGGAGNLNRGEMFRRLIRNRYNTPSIKQIGKDERVFGRGTLGLPVDIGPESGAGILAGIGTVGWPFPQPVSLAAGVTGFVGLGGKGLQSLGRRLSQSADPLYRVLKDTRVPGPVRKQVEKAVQHFNAGEREKYKAALLILLSKPQVRNLLSDDAPEEE